MDFYPWNTFKIPSTILSLRGRKSPAAGPTKQAQTIVPMPNAPPSKNPTATKDTSTMILTIPNCLWDFSLITSATKSFGPVPASDLITIVMPNARITHPRARIGSLNQSVLSGKKRNCSILVKKSIIGPPQTIHKIVPILI